MVFIHSTSGRNFKMGEEYTGRGNNICILKNILAEEYSVIMLLITLLISTWCAVLNLLAFGVMLHWVRVSSGTFASTKFLLD